MAAAANNPKVATKTGVPQSVAREYNKADKGTQMLKQAMQAKALRKQY